MYLKTRVHCVGYFSCELFSAHSLLSLGKRHTWMFGSCTQSTPSKENQQSLAQTTALQTVRQRVSPPYLFQLQLHPWRQHDAGKNSTEEEEGGIDKTCHGGVLAVGTTSAQQTRGAAAQAGNLKESDRNSNGITRRN